LTSPVADTTPSWSALIGLTNSIVHAAATTNARNRYEPQCPACGTKTNAFVVGPTA
jgi:hypothetical protein